MREQYRKVFVFTLKVRKVRSHLVVKGRRSNHSGAETVSR